MLTTEVCKSRRHRFWEKLRGDNELMPKPGAIVLSHPTSLEYFANYVAYPYSFRSTNSTAALVMTANGWTGLIADTMVEPFAKQAFVDNYHLVDWYDGIHSAGPRGSMIAHAIFDCIGTISNEVIGIEAGFTPIGMLLDGSKPAFSSELVDISAQLRQFQRVKDPQEVEVLKRCALAAEFALASARRQARPGMTEKDLYRVVHASAMAHAGEPITIYGDFVCGANTIAGGGLASDKKISKGDLILLDFCVVIGHYRADFASTFVVGKVPSAQEDQYFSACLRALEAGESKLLPGTPAKDVYQAVHQSFKSEGIDKLFTHHAGHGIGLGHPELPYFVPASSDTLLEGEVVTIEPGVYDKDVGGFRVERTYLVTKNGPVPLTNHPLALSLHDDGTEPACVKLESMNAGGSA